MTGHRLEHEGRRQIGMTPIRPSRPLYGTTGRCECGQPFRSNEAPSKGGRANVRRLHRAHVQEVSQ